MSSAQREYSRSESRMNERKGVAIATLGVACVTPDAVLLRWASASGAKMGSVVFWKGFLMSFVVVCFVAKDGKRPFSAALKHPLKCVGMGCLQAISIALLSYSFVLTYAANAVLCYSMHPLWSAVFGWIFLQDILPLRTILALVGAMVSMVVMFYPEISTGSFGGGTNSLGDAFAVTTSITMAMFLTCARAMSRSYPEVSVPLNSALGLLTAAVATAVVAPLTGTARFPIMPTQGFIATAIDAVAVGSVNIAFSVAPKYITAAQVGLISLIEAVFGPVWVFAIYGEVPPIFTIIGGVMIIAVLAGHELARGGKSKKTVTYSAAARDDERVHNDTTTTTTTENVLDAPLIQVEDGEATP